MQPIRYKRKGCILVADEKRFPSLELGCCPGYTSILLDVRRSPCRGYIGKMKSKDMSSLMSFYYMGQKFILKLNLILDKIPQKMH